MDTNVLHDIPAFACREVMRKLSMHTLNDAHTASRVGRVGYSDGMSQSRLCMRIHRRAAFGRGDKASANLNH